MRPRRADLTDWVTHFVHDPDGHNGTRDAGDAFAVLLSILRDGVLVPSWAVRGGVRTVYGPRPAVCFTEMPIGALIEYAKQRPADRVRAMGVSLLRRELYVAGGRPVIAGLSAAAPAVRVGDERLLPVEALPLHEQYRYVSLSLGEGAHEIDWTGEREWRWAADPDDARHRAFVASRADAGTDEESGLPLFRPCRGEWTEPGYFSRLVILVETDEQAQRVLKTAHALGDAGGSQVSEVFDARVLREVRVVVAERVGRTGAPLGAIESLPTEVFHSVEIRDPTESDAALVRAAIADATVAGIAAAAASLAANGDRGPVGWALIETNESLHPSVRALLALGAARGGDGNIVVRLPNMSGGAQALSVDAAAAHAAAEVLGARLGIAFAVRTVLD